jgi:hypothetical protein
MSEKHDCGGDAAAYVLGALGRQEADAFQAHMAECVVCRDEVATLQQVSDSLEMAVPQYEAPKGLRREVMRAVRAEPRGKARAPARRWTLPGSLVSVRPAPAAGLAVVIAAIAVIAIGTSGGSSATQVYPASIGQAEVRVTGGHGELVVQKLRDPGAGRIYEVWLGRPGHKPAPTSTLFSVTASGRSDVGLPGSLKGVDEILVTSEPAGGSQVPTRAPVIVAPLTKSA